MKNRHSIVFIIVGLLTALCGCAALPAVQVAGGALTGYDAIVVADEFVPRDSVEGGSLSVNTDLMLERRLRERLAMQNLRMVNAHVFNRHAYLIGQFHDRKLADRAVATAKNVQGLRKITCKFYSSTTPLEANLDAQILKLLATELGTSKRLDKARLRTEVIRKNAIIVGVVDSQNQKVAALDVASRVNGVQEVIDYITVIAPQGTQKTAAN